jgi:hypothetical protein
MRKGNPANLKPRTQEGLQSALVASVSAWAPGMPNPEAATAIRKAMMKHGYMAKVFFENDTIVATSGALRGVFTV